MEFVAEFADLILFLHNGQCVLSGPPAQVFRQALYFSPPIARVFREIDPDITCLADAIEAGYAL
jgi:energy-coupling factor transport system ATP-binding protein